MSNEKTLESKTLVSAMEERAQQYESLREQFVSLKSAFQGIVDLSQFKGKGANSIKAFYQAQIDVVTAWINLIDVKVAFFKGIDGTTEDLDLSGETIVQVPFLENDLQNAYSRANDIVTSQQNGLRSIFHSIDDIVSLDVFSRQTFDEQIDNANKKRKDTIENVITLDEGLVEEYKGSELQENVMIGLFSELLNATSQGGTISPINFNAEAYHNSEIYKLRDEAAEQTTAYLQFKDDQIKQREIQKKMEEMENRPWYEKLWDTASTFVGEVTGYYDYLRAKDGVDPVTGVELSEAERIKAGTFAAAGFIPVVGWIGRGLKGGKAIYATVKGVNAVDHSLDVYKYSKSFDILHKTEYGIYGLASANGFSEYITGKDMFGNELNEEKRLQSLTEALFLLGVGGVGYKLDGYQNKNTYYTPEYKKNISKVKTNNKSRMDYLRSKHGNLTSAELHSRINIRGINEEAINFGSKKTWEEFVGASMDGKRTIEEIKNSYIKLIKEQSPWPEGYEPVKKALQPGDSFEMVLDNAQPLNKPGGFGTFDKINGVDYAKNNLAIKSNWKEDFGKVVIYKVKEGVELPVLEGPVGAQIDLAADKLLPGGGTQVQIILDRNVNRMDYLEIVSVRSNK